MIEFGTLLQDRYLIERQIGEGGMGAVYAAIDQRFGSQVAIKETFYKDDELGEAFEREAHLLNSLHHPALPHVSDFFAEKKRIFPGNAIHRGRRFVRGSEARRRVSAQRRIALD